MRRSSSSEKRRRCSKVRRSAATATCGSSRRARCDSEARRLGYVKAINDAGGVVLTDTCSAFAQAIAAGHESGGARFGEAGALSAGDSRRAGVVRLDARLHPGGGHRPLERRAAMTVSATIVLRGRRCSRRPRRRRSARDARRRFPAGAASTRTGRHHRNAPRAARRELQGQGAGVSGRQGIVWLVGDVSHGAAGRERHRRRSSSTR